MLIFSIGFGQKNKSKIKEPPSTEINGEVFVVTKGGSIIKLPLVSINFLSSAQYYSAVDTTSKYYIAAIDYLNEQDSLAAIKKIEDDYELPLAAAGNEPDPEKRKKELMDSKKNDIAIANKRIKFTTDLRAPHYAIQLLISQNKRDVITCISNSEGKFTVKIKSKSYIVTAFASRNVSKQLSHYKWSENEYYRWAFEYSPDDQPLLLSNNNMSN